MLLVYALCRVNSKRFSLSQALLYLFTAQVACGDFFTGILVHLPATEELNRSDPSRNDVTTDAKKTEAWLFGSNKHGELAYGAAGQDCAMPVCHLMYHAS